MQKNLVHKVNTSLAAVGFGLISLLPVKTETICSSHDTVAAVLHDSPLVREICMAEMGVGEEFDFVAFSYISEPDVIYMVPFNESVNPELERLGHGDLLYENLRQRYTLLELGLKRFFKNDEPLKGIYAPRYRYYVRKRTDPLKA